MFINQTTLPDSTEISNPNYIEYLGASHEICLGTERDLHIYCHIEDEIIYLKSLGPADELPSAESLALSIASHKLIVSTPRGLCLYDIFDYRVERLTGTLVYSTTVVFHRYRGVICQIYFGIARHGLLRLNIDYTPSELPDYSAAILIDVIIFTKFLVSAFATLFNEWREDRHKRIENEWRMGIRS